MEQRRAGRVVDLIPAVVFACSTVIAFTFLFTLPQLRSSAASLTQSISQLWLSLLLLPLAAGLFLLLRGRRFWAWPFVYLTALFAAFSGLLSFGGSNSVDLAFEYARITLLSITVVVAELVGLSAGRLFNRLLAVAYFGGAAVWLIAAAVERTDGAWPLQWRCAVLLTAALGFLLQATIQLAKYLRRQRALNLGFDIPDEDGVNYSEGWQEDDETEPLPEPAPTVNADALPWKVIIGEKPPQANSPLQQADNLPSAADGLPEKG